jgi:hypothetical protein
MKFVLFTVVLAFCSIGNLHASCGSAACPLNNIADSALSMPEEKRTVGGIFRTALWNKPSMLIEVAKVFVS